MNPLTSIQSLVPPELSQAAIVKNATAATPANIPIQELKALTTLPLGTGSGFPSSAAGNPFSQLLTEVVAKQNTASQMVNGVLSAQGVPLHQAMISMQEANLSFQLMLEVRNKLLESYQELMRMQI